MDVEIPDSEPELEVLAWPVPRAEEREPIVRQFRSLRQRSFHQRHVFVCDLAVFLDLCTKEELERVSAAGVPDEEIIRRLNAIYALKRAHCETLDLRIHTFKKPSFDVFVADFQSYMGKHRSGKTYYEGLQNTTKRISFAGLNLPSICDDIPQQEIPDSEPEEETVQTVVEQMSSSDPSLQDAEETTIEAEEPVSGIEADAITEEELLRIVEETPEPMLQHHRLRKKKFSQLHVYTTEMASYLGLMTPGQLDNLFEKGFTEQQINRMLNRVYLRKKQASSNPRYSKKSFYTALGEVSRSHQQEQQQEDPDLYSQLQEFIVSEESDMSDDEAYYSEGEKENLSPRPTKSLVRRVESASEESNSSEDDIESEKTRFKKRLRGVLPYSFVSVAKSTSRPSKKRSPVVDDSRVGLARRKITRHTPSIEDDLDSFVTEEPVETEEYIRPMSPPLVHSSQDEADSDIASLPEYDSDAPSESFEHAYSVKQEAEDPTSYNDTVNQLYEDTGLDMFGASKESFLSGFQAMLSRAPSKGGSTKSTTRERTGHSRSATSSAKPMLSGSRRYGSSSRGSTSAPKAKHSMHNSYRIAGPLRESNMSTNRSLSHRPSSKSFKSNLAKPPSNVSKRAHKSPHEIPIKYKKRKAKHHGLPRYGKEMFEYGRAPTAATTQIEVLASEVPAIQDNGPCVRFPETRHNRREFIPAKETDSDIQIVSIVNFEPRFEEYSSFNLPDDTLLSSLSTWLNSHTYGVVKADELGFTIPVSTALMELDLYHCTGVEVLRAKRLKLVKDVSDLLVKRLSLGMLLTWRKLFRELVEWAVNLPHNAEECAYFATFVTDVIQEFLAKVRSSPNKTVIFVVPYLIVLQRVATIASDKAGLQILKVGLQTALQDLFMRTFLKSNYSWHLSCLYENDVGSYMYESFCLFLSLIDGGFFETLKGVNVEKRSNAWWESLAHFLRLVATFSADLAKKVLPIHCDLLLRSPMLQEREANTSLFLLIRDLVSNGTVEFTEALILSLYKIVAAHKFAPLETDPKDTIKCTRHTGKMTTSDSTTASYLKLLTLYASKQTAVSDRLIEKLTPMGSLLRSDRDVLIARFNVLFCMQDLFKRDFTPRFVPIVDAVLQLEGLKGLDLAEEIITSALASPSPCWSLIIDATQKLSSACASEISDIILMSERNSAVTEHLANVIRRLELAVHDNSSAIHVLDIIIDVLGHQKLWSTYELVLRVANHLIEKADSEDTHLQQAVRRLVRALAKVATKSTEIAVGGDIPLAEPLLDLCVRIWVTLKHDWSTVQTIYWPYFATPAFRDSTEILFHAYFLKYDSGAFASNKEFFRKLLFRSVSTYQCLGLCQFVEQLAKLAAGDKWLKFPLYIDSVTTNPTRFERLKTHLLRTLIENVSLFLRHHSDSVYARELLEELVASIDKSYEAIMYDRGALVVYKPFVEEVVSTLNLWAFHALRTNIHLIHLNRYLGISSYGELEDAFVEKILRSENLIDLIDFLVDEYTASVRHKLVYEFEEKLVSSVMKCPSIFGEPGQSLSKLYPICAIVVALASAGENSHNSRRALVHWTTILLRVTKRLHLGKEDTFCILKAALPLGYASIQWLHGNTPEDKPECIVFNVLELLYQAVLVMDSFDDIRDFKRIFGFVLEINLPPKMSFLPFCDEEGAIAAKLRVDCESLIIDVENMPVTCKELQQILQDAVTPKPVVTTGMIDDINVQ